MELWLVVQEELQVGTGWRRIRCFGRGSQSLPEVEVRTGVEWIWAPVGMDPVGLARAWLEAVGRPPEALVTDDRDLAGFAAARGVRVWSGRSWREKHRCPAAELLGGTTSGIASGAIADKVEPDASGEGHRPGDGPNGL